jgi:rare lipoprotein A
MVWLIMCPISIRFGLGIAVALFLVTAACAPTRLAIHAAKEAARFTDQNKVEQEAAQSTAAIPSQRGTYKVGNPYEIDGFWYYPKEDPDYRETGIASWYGKQFHGQATANGETYDMNALTAAHTTLPMPTYVRVTNLENGRALTLRVNDRGPFVHGRIIDVSRRGAQLLGFEKKGVARVRVEAVPPPDEIEIAAKPETPDSARFAVSAAPVVAVDTAELPPPKGVSQAPRREPPQPPVNNAAAKKLKPTQLYIQAGAFLFIENAERLQERVAILAEASVAPAKVNGREWFRVRVGPLTNLAKADETLERLIDNGHINARIIVE